MSVGRTTALCLLIAALILVAAGCGGSDTDGGDAPSATPPAVVAKANATCRYFFRATQRLGQGALAGFSPTRALEITTERLVRPSIPLLKRVAKRQQALKPMANNARFDLYADLFDPMIVIAQDRVRAGRAGDYEQSRNLEELLTELGVEQVDVARRAGLRDCTVDFQRVLLSGLSG